MQFVLLLVNKFRSSRCIRSFPRKTVVIQQEMWTDGHYEQQDY